MKIFFQCKSPGIARQSIEPVLMEIRTNPVNVAGLIRSIVEEVLEDYNRRAQICPDDPTVLIEYIDKSEIQSLATTGKIAFGLIYNEKSVSLEQAIETALRSYEDGLFKIFLNNELLGDLDSDLSIADGDLLSVVRLTFLSGRIV